MLRLLEGFDHYGVSGRSDAGLDDDVAIRHRGELIGAGDLITGRGSNNVALQWDSTNPKIYLSRYDATQSDTWIMGFAFKFSDASSLTGIIWEAVPSVLRLYSAKGSLRLYTSDWTESVNYTLKPNRWYYIEIKVYFHTTLGTVEIRINGQTVYTTTNKDTENTSYTTGGVFQLYLPESQCAFDDVYICDDTGSYNNDFLGPIKVETLRPDGDDGSQNWTPSAGGDHYALVDNANMWETGDYIEANGANIDDLWTYAALSKITGTIQGVQLITSVWTDTGLPQVLEAICDSGTTVDYANARGVGVDTNPIPYEVIWETDPDTDNAWTISGINNASFGVRKV